MKFTYTKNL